GAHSPAPAPHRRGWGKRQSSGSLPPARESRTRRWPRPPSPVSSRHRRAPRGTLRRGISRDEPPRTSILARLHENLLLREQVERLLHARPEDVINPLLELLRRRCFGELPSAQPEVIFRPCPGHLS